MIQVGTPGQATLTLAVVICTYRRPDALLPCLAGLAAQDRLPDDVILVVRPTDADTFAALNRVAAAPPNWRVVSVEQPGLVAARNTALAACTCDIAAFCDDDTIAAPDWVARIHARFIEDAKLGGLGGRDRCHDGKEFDERRRRVVGRLQWFGRPVGNHHLGFGGVREVDFLKGANMSFRMEAVRGVRFDERLRGGGAQPHDDLTFSLAVRRTGWRMLYDPAVTLDHYAAVRDQPRSYVATAGLEDADGYYDAAFNLTLALQHYLSGHRLWLWRLWFVLIGMRAYPGLLQAIRLTPGEGANAWRKFGLCLRATSAASATLRERHTQTALRERRTG